MAIHDFDIEMVNVSIVLAQYRIVNRLICNISVSVTKKRYATVTNEMHHSVTPELLAGKRGIDLEKSK